MTRHVNIYKLVIEGFRSYAVATEFPINGVGLNLIKGLNGAGKTSAISALTWALYKTNLNGTVNSKIPTWKARRTKEWRGTRVVVCFESGGKYYMLARHVAFKGTTKGIEGGNNVMLFRSDSKKFEQSDLVGEERHGGDIQDYVERVIGMDSRAFLNSVVFGQRMARLVSADNEEKRKLFEKIFELDFIEQAKDKCKLKLLELGEKLQKTDTTSIDSVIETKKESIEKDNKILEEFKQWKKEGITKYEEALETVKSCIMEYKGKVDKLTKFLAKQGNEEALETAYVEQDSAQTVYDEALDKVVAGKKVVRDYEREVDKVKENIAKLESDLKEVKTKCPYCDGKLSADKVKTTKAAIQNQIDIDQNLLEVLAEKLLKAKVELPKLSKDKEDKEHELQLAKDKVEGLKPSKEVRDKKEELTSAKALLKSHEGRLAKAEEDLKQAKEKKEPKIDTKVTEKEIAELEARKKKLEKEAITLGEERDRVEWWSKKGFGAGGVKAFVFSAMLNQLNEYVVKYASRLGYKVVFSVDLSKASRPFVTKCYVGNHEVDYDELSGGQKQRLDIALAFAMHDVIAHRSNVNILVLDEVFEGLDRQGIEEVFDLIRIKAEDRAVFVVTHQQDIDSLNSKSIIIRADENGATYIE